MNAPKRQVVSSKNKLVKQWLVFAEEDFVWAESSLKEGIWRGACFACQQSFEKYLKAYLTDYNINFPKTHDLNKLLNLCAQIDQNFEGFYEAAAILTPYVGTTRYPDLGDLEFSSKQANQALEFTKQIKNFIEEKFS